MLKTSKLDSRLKELLKGRVLRLHQLMELGEHSPATIVAEVGLVLTATRQLYGPKEVDRRIDIIKLESDARRNGFCANCYKVKVGVDEDFCQKCRSKNEELLVKIYGNVGSIKRK